MKRPFFHIGFMYFVTLMMLPVTGRRFHVFLLIVYSLSSLLILSFGKSRRENAVIILAFVFSVFAVFSYEYTVSRKIVPLEKLDGKTALIKGYVSEREKDSFSGASRCIVTVDRLESGGKDIREARNSKIRLSSRKYSPEIGDYIEYTGSLYSLYGDNRDKRNYYRGRKMVLGSFTYGEIGKSDPGETGVKGKDILKRKIQKGIRSVSDRFLSPLDEYFSREYKGILKGMLTGDRKEMKDEQAEIFKRTGILHLFAVSGFHTALWSMVIYKALLLSGAGKRRASVFSVIFILFFMALTGFPKSGIRAGIMLIVFFLGRLMKLGADSLNSLGFSVFLILLFNPLSGGDLSLKLSCFATLGILVLYPVFFKILKKRLSLIGNEKLRKFLEAFSVPLLVSLAAFVSTLPFMITGFGGVSLTGPLTNLLVSEAASMIILLSGIGCVFGTVPVLSLLTPWFYLVSGLLLKYLLFVTEKLSGLRKSYVEVNSGWLKITLAAILLLIAASVFLAPPAWRFNVTGEYRLALERATEYWYRITGLLCLIILLSSVLLHSILYRGVYTVNFADTGNGTCIVCCHEGSAFILGCGGEKDKVTDSVRNILSENGADNVTCLIVPRKEETESGSLETVSSVFGPEKIFLPESFETGEMPGGTETEFIEDKRILPLPGVSFEMDGINGTPSGVLKVRDLEITLLFRPCRDLSDVPTEYTGSHIYYSRREAPEELKRAEDSTIIVSDYRSPDGSAVNTGPGGVSVNYRNGRYALRRLKF